MEEDEVKCKYMRKSGKLYYIWSDEEDAWQIWEDIICSVSAPIPVNTRNQFTFEKSDFQKIRNILSTKKKINFM